MKKNFIGSIERLCSRINEESKKDNLDENLSAIIIASGDGKSVTANIHTDHDTAVNLLVNTMANSPQFAYSVITAVEVLSKHVNEMVDKTGQKEEKQ